MAQPEWSDFLVAALPDNHPLAAQDVISLADLGQQPLVLAPRRVTPVMGLAIGRFRA